MKNEPNNTSSNRSVWEGMFQTSTALYPAYYPSWVLEEVPDLDYPDATGDRLATTRDMDDNPYTSLHQGSFRQKTASTIYSDLILKQNLDFITKGLAFNGKVSLSTYFNNETLKADWTFPVYELNFDNIGSGINPWKRNGQSDDVLYKLL